MPPTPRDIDVARGFWAQAQEDLLVARLLLTAQRYSSALVACQHAAEKAMKAMMTLQLGDGTFKYDHRMIDALSNALPLVFSRLDFSCVARNPTTRVLASEAPPSGARQSYPAYRYQLGIPLVADRRRWCSNDSSGVFPEKARRRALCAGHRAPPCRPGPGRAYPAPFEAEIAVWHE